MSTTNAHKSFKTVIGIVAALLVACSAPTAAPTPVAPTVGATPTTGLQTTTPAPILTSTPVATPTAQERADGLSEEEAATLSSLEQVDDYPLYTMHYYGAYQTAMPPAEGGRKTANVNAPNPNPPPPPAWACSLFAALGDAEHMLYGRNFDWEFSPAVLLFTDPSDGYASVSMVDIAYLGFEGAKAPTVTGIPLVERRALLYAPFLPFDGMNEHGLAVGIAAVPDSEMPHDPGKETIDSLRVIREMLDHARTVDEAVAILQSYNISWQNGPPLHYLMADSSGQAVLVEFYRGEMIVIPNETPWHLATNFLRTAASETAQGECQRYDKIYHRLTETRGQITSQGAIDLLKQVSQPSTQWSIVYSMTTGELKVTMGRQYDIIHTFNLKPPSE